MRGDRRDRGSRLGVTQNWTRRQRFAAGLWREKLLPLPGFLRLGTAGTPAEWADGLRLTGHFLERNAFGALHRPLPLARRMLYDQVMDLANKTRP